MDKKGIKLRVLLGEAVNKYHGGIIGSMSDDEIMVCDTLLTLLTMEVLRVEKRLRREAVETLDLGMSRSRRDGNSIEN